MEFDPKRAARIDVKKRRQREDAHDYKRILNQRSWDEDMDDDDDTQDIRPKRDKR